jgi:flagellar protein FlaG
MDVKVPPQIAGALPIGAEPAHPSQLAEHRELIQAVRVVNGAELLGEDKELSYQLDRRANRVVLRLVNRKTNEVIRQIPAEYVLQLAREMRQRSS